MDAIFDTQAISLHRRRALNAGDRSAAFLLNGIAQDMAERLSLIDRNFSSVTVTSGNASLVDRRFLAGKRHEAIVVVDGNDPERWVANQEEQALESRQSHDLALSFLTLHETNDTPGALVHIRNRLKPDGLFMGVMAGAGTLQELRESWLAAETEMADGAGPHVYPFADVRSAGSLLQRAGFALPVVDSDSIVVRYADMFGLMRDLRAMGTMNALLARRKTFTRRDIMLRAAEIYHERFAQSDGRITATFNFIWMSGWAPDASQQKPARRGSAVVSLENALRTLNDLE